MRIDLKCIAAARVVVPVAAASVCAVCVAVGALADGGVSGEGPQPVASVGAGSKAPLYPVFIKRPAGTPTVATGLTNFHGKAVRVSCGSCHATTAPNIETRTAAELDQFHQGLKYAHGHLTCLSCHNAQDYDRLRMADSRPVDFTDSMTLCSQCHGPQRRDYDMGLHGGMNGHWDLAKGGRTRNTCVNCHDPHAPAFPVVMPVLAPRDRVSVPAKPGPKPPKH